MFLLNFTNKNSSKKPQQNCCAFLSNTQWCFITKWIHVFPSLPIFNQLCFVTVLIVSKWTMCIIFLFPCPKISLFICQQNPPELQTFLKATSFLPKLSYFFGHSSFSLFLSDLRKKVRIARCKLTIAKKKKKVRIAWWKKSQNCEKKKKHNYLVSFLFYSAGKLASKVFFSSFCSTAFKKITFLLHKQPTFTKTSSCQWWITPLIFAPVSDPVVVIYRDCGRQGVEFSASLWSSMLLEATRHRCQGMNVKCNGSSDPGQYPRVRQLCSTCPVSASDGMAIFDVNCP